MSFFDTEYCRKTGRTPPQGEGAASVGAVVPERDDGRPLGRGRPLRYAGVDQVGKSVSGKGSADGSSHALARVTVSAPGSEIDAAGMMWALL
jgi:hypothetical protein